MASSSQFGVQGSATLPLEANDHRSSNDQIDLHTQLWQECAGSTVKVPRAGDKVFYFPQGHLEQVGAYMKEEGMSDNIPSYGLPSKILCKVVSVHLKAEVDTDEVYAEITLIPECEEGEGSSLRSVPEKIPASSFRKKLTPSDVSKQGGCSLHKKYVDQAFPPLDLSQEAPSQELYARDLQGKLWSFHHICRGIPKRHLLTTGWGKFVSAKRLLVGDTCIFLRGKTKNELYIGVQRAVRRVKLTTDLSTINIQHGILVTAWEAVNTRTEFTVFYHPRMSPWGFIVAYDDFMESLKVDYSPKTRVEMIVDEGGEEHELNLKRFSGTITGKEEVDPARWPSSEWRSLKVSWDDTACGHVPPERVSPWDIKLFELTKHQQSLVTISEDTGLTLTLTFTPPKVNTPSSSCLEESKPYKLFGVEIWDADSLKQQSQSHSHVARQSCIKVLKHGALLGRSINLSRFSGYEGLVCELDQMFDFEGTLASGTSGWLVTYADGDGNKKLLGDLPWFQFKEVVRRMCICPMEEAAKLTAISEPDWMVL